MSPNVWSALLDSGVMEWAGEHRKENVAVYEHCEKLSRSSVELLTSLKIMNTDVKEITTACLFARSIEFYQGIVGLLAYGHCSPAKALLRCLFEAVLTVIAISQSDDTLRDYIAQDDRIRLRLANTLRSTQAKNLEHSRRAATDELIASLKSRVKTEGIRELGAEDLARRAGLHEQYIEIYKTLSPTVHSKPRDLQRYFVLDSEEVIASFKFGPDDSETLPLLCTASLTLLNVHAAVDTVFNHNIGEQHAKLREFFEMTGEATKSRIF